MSSKYIDNAKYATSGYALTGAYQAITIGAKGTIGGAGLSGNGRVSYTVDNTGTISGSYYASNCLPWGR
jgi:hypothetical protein